VEIFFASNLKKLRLESEQSQAQVAKKLNITQRKLSFLECGVSEPDLGTLVAIAKYFEISLDELVAIEY